MRRALAMVLLACLAGGAAAQFRVPGFQQAPAPGAKPGLGPVAPGSSAAARGPQLIDRIVAVVNTEVITQRDLAERMTLVENQLKRQGTPPPAPEVLERQVLERMIMDRVQVQFARDTGVRVDDLQVDRTVQLIAENNKLTLADFRRTLEREGVSFDRFREDIRNEIVISRLREREVDSKIQIGESEIDNFLQELQAGDAGAQFDLSHILVRVPENASPEQIDARLKRAREALAKARAGGDFAQLAVSYSDAPDALKGGGMGWRERDRLPELFADAVLKLKPGDVSDVLRSPAGFHILRLNNRRGGGGAFMVDQTRARHILARVNDLVSETEARRKITVLRQRIVDGANFAELARLNSDDSGSAQRGGELGWTVPGDLVPEFERAMNALKVGELSEPVRTPFGYHIIQVEERRTADLGADRKRVEARRVLRDRRADEAYQEWLRQLRDRSYVDLRLDER
jgi:peptidyl-prolyl cis-trans isomerase SurA